MSSPESFAGFYQRYYRLVLTVAHQRLGSFSDAEDITADVFRVAWREHQGGRELSLPWLYQVLRNCVGNEYQRRDRAVNVAGRIAALDHSSESADPVDDDAIDLRRHIADLSEADAELLYMTYWEDLTRGEVAQILGCTAGTVRIRLMRARHRLKASLAKRAPEHCEATDGRP